MANESRAPEVLDAFLTGAGARTEHYEIAAYEGLVTMAGAMGEDDLARMLTENLEAGRNSGRYSVTTDGLIGVVRERLEQPDQDVDENRQQD